MCLIKWAKHRLTYSIPFFLDDHDIAAVGYNLGIIKGASIWCKWLTQSNIFLKKAIIASKVNSDKKHNFISLLTSYIVYIQQKHSYEGGCRKCIPQKNEVNITSKLTYELPESYAIMF